MNNEKYDYIDKDGFYVIENYDKKSPFASFLAGIAGKHGIPMWTFYVNRGQSLNSFGIKDKNNAIMEFYPANEAYKLVYSNGFRTFIKIIKDKNTFVYEPFAVNLDSDVQRTLKIKNNEIKLIEINDEVKIKTIVTYFTMPNEDFAALGRKVEIENMSGSPMNIELVDGAAAILTYGTNADEYKKIGNTKRSWMEADINDSNVALYSTRSDKAVDNKENYSKEFFYAAFDEDNRMLIPIVDPEDIFGYDTSLKEPIGLINDDITNLLNKKRPSFNKVPCAFTGKAVKLIDKTAVYSYIGYSKKNSTVLERLNKICSMDFFERKIDESNKLIGEITRTVDTKTAYPLFDKYIKQCYVDNVLRGGYPLQLGNDNKKTYYIYSRKHGDLERDYNFFSIEPNYYSQGNGNFRDVNQNRRMDVYMYPFTGSENIKLFNNLIQLDGYNPLVIKGKKFYVEDDNDKKHIFNLLNDKAAESVKNLLDTKFTIGELYSCLKDYDDVDENMNKIIDLCSEDIEAEFTEGYWSDHWTYNLDSIEEYLNIYPDKIKELLIEDKTYKFFNSPIFVLPRKEKYFIENGRVVQKLPLREKKVDSSWIKTLDGSVYTTNLFVKIFMLSTIKFMTLDPFGFGIEMEGGNPGWNDAMDGLPGLIGSGFSETAELKRLLLFILNNISAAGHSVSVPEEFYNTLSELNRNLELNLDGSKRNIDYWDEVASLREDYREKVKDNISGSEKEVKTEYIKSIVTDMIKKIDNGIVNMKSMNDGHIAAFMYYNAKKYDVVDGAIKPLDFEVEFLPTFLEGETRYFKTGLSREEKINVYNYIKNSGVYDKKLKMYKTSSSLKNVSPKIGRARTFTAGWLERESVFMHMEFKYILELIKNGLYEQFFGDMKNVMPPFLNPEVYGRSTLENSSFIASSANPDERIHGKGYVARLSGTTVEMLNIWRIMMTGHHLFKYENNELVMTLKPILTRDFFKDSKLSTTLLGKTKLVYVNHENKDTFGDNKGVVSKIKLVLNDDENITIYSNEVKGTLAEKVRNGEVKEIEAVIL